MTTFDLHMHSLYSSDGQFTCQELIEKVKEAKLSLIALSDHNTAQGVDEMMQLGKQNAIRVIPAIECDTLFDGLEVHVLSYGLNHHTPYFEKLPQQIAQLKQGTMTKRIAKLNEYFDMELDAQALLQRFGTMNPFPAIVDYFLKDPRYANKPAFQPYQPGGERCEPACVNFYWDMCSAGNPCYVHVPYPSLQETVEHIHEAGGIAIIAHPFRNFFHQEERLEKALSQGIDGIEAYSNYHTREQNLYYEDYCQKHHVLMSCGSDFHGKMKPKIQLGEYGYEGNHAEIILQQFLYALANN